MIRIAMLAGVLVALAGCVSPADLNALAADKNADCITETSVWVTMTAERNWGCHFPPPGFVLVPASSAIPAK